MRIQFSNFTKPTGQDILADGSGICFLLAAELLMHAVFRTDVHRGIRRMRRAGIEIEVCRMRGITGSKQDFLTSAAHIQTVAAAQGIAGAVHGHGAFATDIDNAHFPALQEILGTQLIPGIQ